MKFYKLKTNEDSFKFHELVFDDNLNLTNESREKLVEFLNQYLELIECNTEKDFISIISEDLKLDNQMRIGNTIDIYTTNKKIYQMCYLEENSADKNAHKDPFNFLGTIINNKRKMVQGNVFIFCNSLTTTNIQEKSNIIEYIKPSDISFDEVIDVILSNYFFKGLYFEGDKYGKFLFDNNMDIIAPSEYKGTKISELSFKRSDLLNFTIDVFFDSTGKRIKEKYNNKLSLFYLQDMNSRIFISLRSETEKKYDSILDDYVNKILIIYDKFCFDDQEINVPKELKFYDYQSNDRYTNKYIVFDNLYNKIVVGNTNI